MDRRLPLLEPEDCPLNPIPTFFSWYHVDPLLKKEIFRLDNRPVSPKIPEKKWVFGAGGTNESTWRKQKVTSGGLCLDK